MAIFGKKYQIQINEPFIAWGKKKTSKESLYIFERQLFIVGEPKLVFITDFIKMNKTYFSVISVSGKVFLNAFTHSFQDPLLSNLRKIDSTEQV